MAKERERDKETEQIRSAFGDVLREIRKAKSLSQMELSLRTHYHYTYISQLERGVKQPALSTIFILARNLQVQPEDLIKAVRKKIK